VAPQLSNVVSANLSLLNLLIYFILDAISLKRVNWSEMGKTASFICTNYILNFANEHLCMGTNGPDVSSQ